MLDSSTEKLLFILFLNFSSFLKHIGKDFCCLERALYHDKFFSGISYPLVHYHLYICFLGKFYYLTFCVFVLDLLFHKELSIYTVCASVCSILARIHPKVIKVIQCG